jgi:hypothetical protein
MGGEKLWRLPAFEYESVVRQNTFSSAVIRETVSRTVRPSVTADSFRKYDRTILIRRRLNSSSTSSREEAMSMQSRANVLSFGLASYLGGMWTGTETQRPPVAVIRPSEAFFLWLFREKDLTSHLRPHSRVRRAKLHTAAVVMDHCTSEVAGGLCTSQQRPVLFCWVRRLL